MSAQQPDSLFELMTYLVSAARLSLDESPRYGSLRLLVAASRLVATAEATEGLEVDDTIRAWKQSIDENMLNVMNQFPDYVEWLGDLTRTVGEEAAARNFA
jgi:hypothetical protein